MNNAKIKGFLHTIINLVVNSGIIILVPQEYKAISLLVFNLVQVILAYIDPTYVIQKLGISKQRYAGMLKGDGEIREIS